MVALYYDNYVYISRAQKVLESWTIHVYPSSRKEFTHWRSELICILNNHTHLVNAGDFNEVLAVEEGMISPRQGASLEDITVIAVPPSTGPACGFIGVYILT